MVDEDRIKDLISRLIVQPLNGVVKWDRYTMHEDGSGFIFGWIDREDGHYDYVSVEYMLVVSKTGFLDFLINTFGTSSAKYSEWIGEKLQFPKEGHDQCKSARDLANVNLIAWQQHSVTTPQPQKEE